MTLTQTDRARAVIESEIDNCYSHLEYFQTAFGGDPDSKNVRVFEEKIKSLNMDLNDL